MCRGEGPIARRIATFSSASSSAQSRSARVSSEVANFYPALGGWGWFARIGARIYRYTQLKIHVIVTNGFLRSLARLELVPSKVGQLRTELVRSEDTS